MGIRSPFSETSPRSSTSSSFSLLRSSRHGRSKSATRILIPLHLANFILSIVQLSHHETFFNISFLDPLTTFASLIGLITTTIRVLRPNPRPILTLLHLLILWVPITAGRAYIWGFTLTTRVCISTPWLEDATVKNECQLVAAEFFIALATVVAYAVATAVECVSSRSRAKKWKESVLEQELVLNFENAAASVANDCRPSLVTEIRGGPSERMIVSAGDPAW